MGFYWNFKLLGQIYFFSRIGNAGVALCLDVFESNWKERYFWSYALNPALANDMERLNELERIAVMQEAMNDLENLAAAELVAPLVVVGVAETSVAVGGYMGTTEAWVAREGSVVIRRLVKQAVRRVLREARNEPKIKKPPRPSPKFQEPTHRPQLPPTTAVEGVEVRLMRPTENYPNGYWVIERPTTNGGWEKLNPSTMKPGQRHETHVPLPEGYWK